MKRSAIIAAVLAALLCTADVEPRAETACVTSRDCDPSSACLVEACRAGLCVVVERINGGPCEGGGTCREGICAKDAP